MSVCGRRVDSDDVYSKKKYQQGRRGSIFHLEQKKNLRQTCPPDRIVTNVWKTMRYASGIFHGFEIFFFARRTLSIIFAQT